MSTAGSLLGNKKQNQNAKYSLKRNWMKSISLENPLDALHRRWVSSLLCFQKGTLTCECDHFTKVQELNVATRTISSVFCDMDGFCHLLAHSLVDCAADPNISKQPA
jgi:hypothetical protein